jgi:uncharacterized membrane protein
MLRLERVAQRRSPPRRKEPMPKDTTEPDETTNGHHPAVADRLRRGLLPFPPPRPVNPALLKDAEQRAESVQNRIADKITVFAGSMALVYIHIIWFGCWIGFGVEKYPFGLLTMIVSLEAIFLSTFILISQNYDMRVSERRNQLDLQINLLAEQENTKALQILERIARKVGANVADDPQVRALEEATRPEALVDQIEEAYREDAGQPPLDPSKPG